MPRPSMPRLLFAIAIFLFGLAPLLAGVRFFYLAERSRGWATTAGRLVEKKLEKAGSPVTTAAGYLPRLRYQYDVSGTTYSSTQVFQVPRLMTEDEGATLERSPATAVEVHYNPARPSESFLYPVPDDQRGPLGWRPLVVGLLLCGLGLLVGLRGRRA